MNGKAPNDPATGSHVDVTRNRQPKLCMAGHDFHVSEPARAAASATTVQTAYWTAQSKTRSPDLFVRWRPRDARGSASAVPAPWRDAAGIRPPYFVAASNGFPENVICLIRASSCLTTGAGNGAYRSAPGYF